MSKTIVYPRITLVNLSFPVKGRNSGIILRLYKSLFRKKWKKGEKHRKIWKP